MVKDYFVDGLFLFMFVLSIQNIKWEPQTDLDVVILGGADWQFRRAGGGNLEDGQQIISTITSGTNNRGLWSFESQVHLKSVADQSEVEDVIRKIHLLGQYNNRFSHRTFGTEISAFLLNESLPLANINIAAGALVYGSNEQNISQQSSPTGAEPTKDDLELIDVLWGQDVDLEKTLELTELDQSSRYKLERDMELLLHEKQEEETLEQLVQQEFLDNYFGPSFLSPLNETTNHFGQEIFQSNLNTPEVMLDEHESDNVFFSSHVNSSHQQESLERYHAATTSDATTSDVTTSDFTTSDVTTSDVTTSDFTTSDFTTSDVTAYVLDCDQLNSANYSNVVSVNWSAGCDANEDVSNNILLQNVSLANYPSVSFLQGGEWMSHEQLNNSVSTPFTDISGQQHALPIFQLFNNSHASLSPNNTLTEDNLFGLDEIYEFSHDNDLMACKSKDEHENEVHAEEWGSLRREGDDIFCINFNTDSACAVKSDDLSDCSSCESELDVVTENDKFGDIDSFIMDLLEEQSATPERKKVHLDNGRRIRLFDQFSVAEMNGAYGSSKLTAGGMLDEGSFLDDEAFDCQSNEELINSPPCRPTKMSNHAGSFTVHFNAPPSKTLAGQSHKILKEEKSEIDQSSDDLEQIYSDHNYPAVFREEDFRTKNVNSYSNRINERLENDQLFSTSKKRTGMKNELEFTKTRANFEKNEKPSFRNRDSQRIVELKIPMSLEEIINCPVDHFNEIVSSPRHKLTDEQIRFIKDVRKRGKNKMAAQNCRKRKLDIIQVLEDDVDSLKKEREQMKEEKRMVDKDIEMMRNKIEQLQKEIFESLQTANERYFFNEALNNDGRSYTRNRVFDSNRRGSTLALNGNFINISAGSLNNGYNSNDITKNMSENK